MIINNGGFTSGVNSQVCTESLGQGYGTTIVHTTTTFANDNNIKHQEGEVAAAAAAAATATAEEKKIISRRYSA
jgi:hypothetical protein